MISDPAEFIAQNAVGVLAATTLVLLLITAALWRVLVLYAPALWRQLTAWWGAFRETALARRVSGLPVFGQLLGRTMTTARYLGLFATLAFLISFALISTFLEIADEIGVDNELAVFDSALSAELREHVDRDTLATFATITHLGDRDFLVGLALVVTLVLLVRRRWLLAGAWAMGAATGGVMNQLLKALFARARPFHDHGLVIETSYSFPSGHASGSMLIYGLLGYLLVRHTPRIWHIPIALAAATLIIFVGFSRVILQVHYFSDVLAGYASAAAWVLLCIAGVEAARWRELRRAGQTQL